MKKIFALIISVAVAASVTFAQQRLIPELKGEKYGYVDSDGKVVVKHQYDQALPFENGFAMVQKKGKWGVINEKGKSVIGTDYTIIEPFNDEGMARVQKDNKWGIVNDKGKTVVNVDYTVLEHYDSRGRAKVQKDEKWGYIDKQGKVLIPIKYQLIETFDEKGIARVKIGDKFGYMYDDGRYYIKPDYNFIGSFNDDGFVWVGKGKSFDKAMFGLFKGDQKILDTRHQHLGFFQKTDSVDYSDGRLCFHEDANEIKSNYSRLSSPAVPYIWAWYNGYYMIYDIRGKSAVKWCRYALGAPKDGYSLMRQGSKNKYKFNYISTDGKNKKLAKKDFEQEWTKDDQVPEMACGQFEGGFARVFNKGEAWIIDSKGNKASDTFDALTPIASEGYIAVKNGLYGTVATDGKTLVPPSYLSLEAPYNASTLVIGAKEPTTGLYGFIDFRGGVKIPFEYEYASAFIHGKGYVKKSGKWGVINEANQMVVEPRWDGLRVAAFPADSRIWALDPEDSKWHCIEIATGERAFDEGFDLVDSFNADGVAFVARDRRFGAITADGSYKLPIAFSSPDIATKALLWLKGEGADVMTMSMARRFNILYNPQRHNYRLHQTIPSEMWDY